VDRSDWVEFEAGKALVLSKRLEALGIQEIDVVVQSGRRVVIEITVQELERILQML